MSLGIVCLSVVEGDCLSILALDSGFRSHTDGPLHAAQRHHKAAPNLLSGFVFSVSCCSVPWFLKYIDTKDATAWSPGRFTYIHTCIHTYTLLSGRRFFSFMTGDGHGNEDGDNPTQDVVVAVLFTYHYSTCHVPSFLLLPPPSSLIPYRYLFEQLE